MMCVGVVGVLSADLIAHLYAPTTQYEHMALSAGEGGWWRRSGGGGGVVGRVAKFEKIMFFVQERCFHMETMVSRHNIFFMEKLFWEGHIF